MSKDSDNDSIPDWVRNLFKNDDDRPMICEELANARDWAKQIIKEVNQKSYRDPYWKEYPLIQRENVSLKGEHLLLYQIIRSNPTSDLYQLFINSECDEQKFYEIINDLIRSRYVRILPVYYSIEYSIRQPLTHYLNNSNNH